MHDVITDQQKDEIDWSFLPKDILQCIFTYIFATSNLPITLESAFNQLTNIHLVCRSWREACRDYPPGLHNLTATNTSTPPPSLLSFPIISLKLIHSNNNNNNNNNNNKLALIEGILGIPSPPKWILSSMHHLRHLTIVAPTSLSRPLFTASPLASLSCLNSLSLSGFWDYDLEDLPSSMKYLSLQYGEEWRQDILSSHSMSMPNLPSSLHLDVCILSKPGVIGIPFDTFGEQCRILVVQAMFCIAGVPTDDQDAIVAFERPYREGMYVPPHILNDWEAVTGSNEAADAAVNALLHGLSRKSVMPVLEKVVLLGDGALSMKIVPGIMGNLPHAVPWLHSVTQQATMFLYGVNGAELLDRYLDLLASGRIDEGLLSIELFPLRQSSDDDVWCDDVDKSLPPEFETWLLRGRNGAMEGDGFQIIVNRKVAEVQG